MWTCPKCGREFRRTNQGHYCGRAPATAAEYLAAQHPAARPHLEGVVRAVRAAVPDAAERVKWSMPTWERAGRSLSLSAGKDRVSLYVGEEALGAFRPELDGFATRRAAVYFPYNEPLPEELVGRLAAFCLS